MFWLLLLLLFLLLLLLPYMILLSIFYDALPWSYKSRDLDKQFYGDLFAVLENSVLLFGYVYILVSCKLLGKFHILNCKWNLFRRNSKFVSNWNLTIWWCHLVLMIFNFLFSFSFIASPSLHSSGWPIKIILTDHKSPKINNLDYVVFKCVSSLVFFFLFCCLAMYMSLA